ncbi:MAG: hypothetical protein ATN31_08165 [Candidatus Epulonipiscioides saccharophilum]|nr:MAG: hypothetical protein ATN31_08165 [Epulopiscium sp. AS2M-Bin001]
MITTLYDPALVEKGIEIGEKRGEIKGKKEGEIKGKIEILYIDMKMNTIEIAKRLKIPVEKVEHIIKNKLNL